MASFAIGPSTGNWARLPSHRAWLLNQAESLFAFYERRILNPLGGFYELDDLGRPTAPGFGAGGTPSRHLFYTARIVHAFAIAHLMGRPGADAIVDHGMEFLWKSHRDVVNGGYFAALGYDRPTDPTKQAYGHAFVLLAASSAATAGHPDAARLIDDVTSVIRNRFWEEQHGAVAEEFTADWRPLDNYRGQNSNMHLTEALMAAFEVTGDSSYLQMAERVAGLIIGRLAAANDWRIAEHFDTNWEVDKGYSGSPMFRPFGTTPGHSLEWTRLLLQLWELGGCRLEWAPPAAKLIFERAVSDAWDPVTGGFYYTLDWTGQPLIRDRYWWPCCEAIGAAVFLNATDADPAYEEWYRRIWSFTARCFIDRDNGGWRAQVDELLRPNSGPFYGKGDIYHSLQACLIPTLPTTGSITKGLAELLRSSGK